MMASPNPNALVIDAGVGYALCTVDKATTTLRAEVMGRVKHGTRLFAPTLWRYEVTSILTKAVHFKQLSAASARQALELSHALPVQLIAPTQELASQAFEWTIPMKRAAAYDSFYLMLAQHLGCELWTLDRKLANAAAATWVRYVGSTA